jgi:hypothetical protein
MMSKLRSPWRKAGTEKPVKESAWITSKQAFVTTLVAIALNPVSAAVGYYMNYWLQKAQFQIANVNFSYDMANREFPERAWQALRGNPDLYGRFKETLTRLPADPGKGPCVAWLDQRSEWIDSCGSLVHSVIASFVSMDNRELTALREDKAKHSEREAALERNLRELKNIEEVVLTLNNAPAAASRTGDVTFEVGVMNTGDKDGVIANRAKLKTRDGEIWLAANNFTTVKAHSVAYIEFTIGGAADARVLGNFRDVIRNGERAPIEIALDSAPGIVSRQLVLET